MLPSPSSVEPCISFEHLVEQYHGRIFATAYHLLRNYQDAEDLTQEVLLKIHLAIHTLIHPQAASRWVMRITRNACYDRIDYLRRKPITITLTEHYDPEAMLCMERMNAHIPSLEESVLAAEELRSKLEALANLSPQVRDLLVLSDIEGRSYAEISDMLGIGLSATKMRILRARREFHAELQMRGVAGD
jgi:RNA polymerase sigma-70 factor (ECF subfamily)